MWLVAAIAAPMARPARRKSSVSPVYAVLLIEIHCRSSPRPRSSIGVIHVPWPSAWAAMARASSGSPVDEPAGRDERAGQAATRAMKVEVMTTGSG